MLGSDLKVSVESDSLMSAEKRHLSVWDQTAGLESAYTEPRMIRLKEIRRI